MSRSYRPRPKEQFRGNKSRTYEQAKNNLTTTKPDPFGANLEPPASNIFAKWLKVITKPRVATFASEMPSASWVLTFLGAALYTVAYFMILLIGLALRGKSPFTLIGPILEFTASDLVGTILGLFLSSGLIYLLSKVGEGTGNFTTQTYLYSLYFFPLSIISALSMFIPSWGGSIFIIIIGIYELFLTYYMVQATHRLHPGDALRLVILVFIAVFILTVAFTFAVVAIVLNSVHLGI